MAMDKGRPFTSTPSIATALSNAALSWNSTYASPCTPSPLSLTPQTTSLAKACTSSTLPLPTQGMLH